MERRFSKRPGICTSYLFSKEACSISLFSDGCAHCDGSLDGEKRKKRKTKRGRRVVCLSTLISGGQECFLQRTLLEFSSVPASLYFPPFTSNTVYTALQGFVHLAWFLFQTFHSLFSSAFILHSLHYRIFIQMLLFHKSTTSSGTDCLLTFQQQNKKSFALATAVIAQRALQQKREGCGVTLRSEANRR